MIVRQPYNTTLRWTSAYGQYGEDGVAIPLSADRQIAGHPGDSHAYFVQALKLADQSQVDHARGRALAATAGSLHAPLMGDGDSAAALGMLQAAVPLVGADGLDAKWMAMEQAEHFGERERDYEAMSLIERADRIRLTDDEEGLYSLRGRFAGFDEQRFAAWSGKVLGRLGRTDEALDVVQRQLSAPTVNMRAPAVLLGRIALIHIKGGDPEPACQTAIRSLDASHAVGYTVGVDCILKIREKMRPSGRPWPASTSSTTASARRIRSTLSWCQPRRPSRAAPGGADTAPCRTCGAGRTTSRAAARMSGRARPSPSMTRYPPAGVGHVRGLRVPLWRERVPERLVRSAGLGPRWVWWLRTADHEVVLESISAASYPTVEECAA
ncbi:MAG: hypothetical protein ACRDZ4_03980 [Egibacteraceae bacterium]